LRLILGSGGKPADEVAVVDFLRFALERKIGPQDIWVAVADRKILCAILPMVNPGRSMLMLAPSYIAPAARAAAARLIDAVCTSHQRKIHLAQVLIDLADPAIPALYQSCHFKTMAELIYLQANLRRPMLLPSLPEYFSWQTYSSSIHRQFSDSILESYRDSLDCPSLNGMCDIDDIIAGHKAAGVHDPTLWFMLQENGHSRGVLLLSPSPQSDTMELVYLGLCPQARGRGLSDLLMRQALAITSQRKVGRLSLAVDSRNAPAIKLYHRNGMQRICSKLALMRDLRKEIH
jgi:GNAT superfamily N-acetyltransferase